MCVAFALARFELSICTIHLNQLHILFFRAALTVTLNGKKMQQKDNFTQHLSANRNKHSRGFNFVGVWHTHRHTHRWTK